MEEKNLSEREAKEFTKVCEKFKDYNSIEEYIKDVKICLMYSSWNYSPERAQEHIDNNMWYIKEAYERKEPADDCCAEVGYACG